jgi:hypothetical protein
MCVSVYVCRCDCEYMSVCISVSACVSVSVIVSACVSVSVSVRALNYIWLGRTCGEEVRDELTSVAQFLQLQTK